MTTKLGEKSTGEPIVPHNVLLARLGVEMGHMHSIAMDLQDLSHPQVEACKTPSGVTTRLQNLDLLTQLLGDSARLLEWLAGESPTSHLPEEIDDLLTLGDLKSRLIVGGDDDRRTSAAAGTMEVFGNPR